ncbi:MAG: TetR/AcrR family transcriptional regulator [Solirubrobacterales bacterium]
MTPDAAALPRPADLLTLALDPGVTTPGDPLSERILDAALDLAAASGLRHLTMDAVAARAGVGRMTVYRRFGARAELVQALAVRETRGALATIAAALAPDQSAEDRLAAGFVAALRIAREHPLLRRLSRYEPAAILEVLNSEHDRTLALVRGFLAAEVRRGQRLGALREGDPEAAAELLFRIGLSFVLMPRSVIAIDDDDTAGELARTLIAPIVVAPD